MDSGYPHRGRDAQLPIGTPLVPGADGVVVPFLNSLTQWNGQWVRSFGSGVCIRYDNGLYGLVAHCSEVLVGIGERVSARQVIARSGNSGVSTGPHCHFQVCVNSDFPTDIRASYDPRLLLGDDMSAEDKALLQKLVKGVFGSEARLDVLVNDYDPVEKRLFNLERNDGPFGSRLTALERKVGA